MEVARIIQSIDDHFLLLCQILGRARPATPGALEDATEYERKIVKRRLRIGTEVERCKEHNESKISLEGVMEMIEMANGTEFMHEYWLTALERAKDVNHGITTSIRSFEWKAWIQDLEQLSVPLVEKMNIPPEVIERMDLNCLVSKVELLDKLLDEEFTKPEMDLGERSLHLGEAINQKVYGLIELSGVNVADVK
jgi:hypothetical protein